MSQNKPKANKPSAVAVPEPGAKRYVTTGNVPHLSIDERVARGKAARKEVPRESHALYDPSGTRRDPIKLLQSQAVTRVKELVPIRYGRMLVSPFTFYRGAALIMAADLDGTPRSGFKVQACGDAHLTNFGIFASPERRQVFDINDFDETAPGPWEWDVKRLTASLVVAGRNNGFSTKETRRVVTDTVKQYRDAMKIYAKLGNMDVWYSHLEISDVMARLREVMTDPKRLRRVDEVIAKARTKDSMQAFEKLTEVVDGEPRIKGDPPLVVPVEDLLPQVQREELEGSIRALFHAYRRTLASDRRELLEQFRYVCLARKVVGVGSVGTRAWIALFLGRDNLDPLFLQVKEAQASVLEDFVGKSQYSNAGQRVVAGQRLMQATSDIFLGWQRVMGVDDIERDYYIRQLRDWKGSIEVEQLIPEGMALYGRVCAWTLARAHARSGDRIAIAAYLGGGTAFDQAIADFSEAYADQNERDYEVFSKAVEAGKLKAETGL